MARESGTLTWEKLVTLFVAAAAISGCANLSWPVSDKNLDLKDGATWLRYDSTRRGAIILPATARGNHIFCAEPTPDVALTLANKVKGGKGEASGEIDLSATAVELAGRTQTVLVAREAMFRLCEATMNGYISAEDYPKYFDRILATVELIARETENKLKTESIDLLKRSMSKSEGSVLTDEQIQSIIKGSGLDQPIP